MVPDFDILVTQTEAAAVVRVIGDLDLSAAPRLRGELIGLVERGRRTVTVDLSELDFLDSSGLSVLVTRLKRCSEGGGDLGIRAPNWNAMNVFENTGLTKAFAIS